VEASVPAGTLVSGRWRIVGYLGAGGFGEVLRAVDESEIGLGEAALKVLYGEISPVERDNFVREVQKIAGMRHQNLVGYLDSGSFVNPATPGRPPSPFLVTELCDDGSLDDELDSYGGRLLSLEAVVGVLDDVIAGLAHLHWRELIHRDIKAANVLRSDGAWKLADFGLMRDLTATGSYHRGSDPIGTPSYMAPELFSEASITAASDVYAVGVLAHVCAVGRSLHAGSGTALLLNIAAGNATIAPNLDPRLVEFVRRTTAADPAQRPRVEELSRLLPRQTSSPIPFSAPPPPPPPPPSVPSPPSVVQAVAAPLWNPGAAGVSDRPGLLAPRSPLPPAAGAEQGVQALYDKAIALGSKGRSEEAVHAYGIVVERFAVQHSGHAPDMETAVLVAKAMVNRAVELGALGRRAEEIGAYDEVVVRFGRSALPDLMTQVAMALLNKAVVMDQLARSAEEVAAYDEIISRFGHLRGSEFTTRVARALLNKAVTLSTLDRHEDTVATINELLHRYGGFEEPALLDDVGKALSLRASVFDELGRYDDEIRSYDEIVSRLGGFLDPDLLVWVVKALFNKALTVVTVGSARPGRNFWQTGLPWTRPDPARRGWHLGA